MAQRDDFMDTPLGTFDATPGSTPVADGFHGGAVKAITPIMKRGGEYDRDDNGKIRVKIEVDLEDGTALQRTTSIAFGKNSKNNKFSQWAQFIEAATGIPCGDAAQRQVTGRELQGVAIGVRTRFTGSWTDIEEFVAYERVANQRPPQGAGGAAPRPAAQRPEAQPPAQRPQPPAQRPQPQAAVRPAPQTAPPQTRQGTTAKDAPCEPGQARIRKLASEKGISDQELLAMANRVTPGKPFTDFSAPECARVSMLIGQHRALAKTG